MDFLEIFLTFGTVWDWYLSTIDSKQGLYCILLNALSTFHIQDLDCLRFRY